MKTEKIRKVISKSAKKKISAGDRVKANDYTEMVVYHFYQGGSLRSQTRHEIRK